MKRNIKSIIFAVFFAGMFILGILPKVQARAVAQGVSDKNDDRWQDKHCVVVGVERSDYHIEFTANLPRHHDVPAELDIHRVSPVYKNKGIGKKCDPTAVTVMVHGRSIDIVTGTDIQYADYSLAEYFAMQGIESFGVNLLGWGLSSRFSMDHPCNASTAEQKSLLIPNPLQKTCPASDPFVFTHVQAQVEQLGAAVDHALDETARDNVSIFAWSRGGFVAGPYTKQNPSKVKNIVFLTPGYGRFPLNPPPLPQDGLPMSVANRNGILEGPWTPMVSTACPGQQDPAILDPLWESLKSRDPLGASWGSSGVIRIPGQTVYGWDTPIAEEITAPTLLMTGPLDTIVPSAIVKGLYTDLGSSSKVLINVACASHFMSWEGATSWGGPHTLVQQAAADWMINESFHGSSNGTFEVSDAGHVDGPF